MINKLMIKFHDNDFHSAFTSMLEHLKANAHLLPEDKKKLSLICNEMIYGHYIMFQNKFEYGSLAENQANTSTRIYLQIEPEDILLNDEVTEHMEKCDWDNGESFYFDERGVGSH